MQLQLGQYWIVNGYVPYTSQNTVDVIADLLIKCMFLTILVHP